MKINSHLTPRLQPPTPEDLKTLRKVGWIHQTPGSGLLFLPYFPRWWVSWNVGKWTGMVNNTTATELLCCRDQDYPKP